MGVLYCETYFRGHGRIEDEVSETRRLAPGGMGEGRGTFLFTCPADTCRFDLEFILHMLHPRARVTICIKMNRGITRQSSKIKMNGKEKSFCFTTVHAGYQVLCTYLYCTLYMRKHREAAHKQANNQQKKVGGTPQQIELPTWSPYWRNKT